MKVRKIGPIGLVVSSLLAGLTFPAHAGAKRGLVTGLTGPLQYQSDDLPTRAFWFDRTVAADAGIVRLPISWRDEAPRRPVDPTNPASYDLTRFDGAVRDAAARGLRVLLTLNDAPDWAEGSLRPASSARGAWEPSSSDFADFVQAVAARYSGSFDPDGTGPEPPVPAAYALQVWNEPNQEAWFGPQIHGRKIIGPGQYRRLLNASYKAVKAVNPGTLVVTGGTSPYGDPPGGPYPAGGARVRPVQWWLKLLCVRTLKRQKRGKSGKKSRVRYARAGDCAPKPLFDVLAHHPIDNTGGGPLRHGPHHFDASTPDLGRIVRVLRAAERLGTVRRVHHPVWVTEFWWDSDPPNPAGSPLPRQARWIEQSLYLFWKAGASTAINFRVRDGLQYLDVRGGYQAGVYFRNGRPKPALTAFRFPFVTERINQRSLRAWGKAPESGELRIERRQGSRWRTVKRLRIAKGRVFLTKLHLPGAQRLRATVGGSTSLVWKQSARPR